MVWREYQQLIMESAYPITIVIAAKGRGKSTMIAALLAENARAMCIVRTDAQAEQIKAYASTIGGATPWAICQRIVIASNGGEPNWVRGQIERLHPDVILVDEPDDLKRHCIVELLEALDTNTIRRIVLMGSRQSRHLEHSNLTWLCMHYLADPRTGVFIYPAARDSAEHSKQALFDTLFANGRYCFPDDTWDDRVYMTYDDTVGRYYRETPD